MSRKVNLADNSTWTSTAYEEPVAKQKKHSVAAQKPETQKETEKRKIISLPLVSTGFELPAFNHAKDNPAFKPRQSWDVGREKYVVKYPPGYDPVTRTFSKPSEVKEKPAEDKKTGVWARLGNTLRENARENSAGKPNRLAGRLGEKLEPSKGVSRRVVLSHATEKRAASDVQHKRAVGTKPVNPVKPPAAKEAAKTAVGGKRSIVKLGSTTSKLEMSLEEIVKKKPRKV